MTHPKLALLTPENSTLLMIDYQPQMVFGVASIDRQTLKNNAVGLGKSAKLFKVPTTLTSIATKDFSGFVLPEILDVFPDQDILERTSINSWDDQKVRKALRDTGRKKLILAGLWTELCINLPALSFMQEGYEIYVVEDACGGVSDVVHRAAMNRMIQVGVVPMTWQQVLLEWQRDWSRKTTYNGVMEILVEHSGAYGMGVDYVTTMLHKQPQRTKSKGKIVS